MQFRPIAWRIALSILAACCGLISAAAQDAEKADWEGTLELGGAQLRLRLELARGADGVWSGTLVSVDQGNARIPLDEVQWTDQTLSASAKQIQFEFEGRLSEDGKAAEGTFKQFGRSMPLALRRTEPAADLQLVETWWGVLEAGPKRFEFQVRILKGAGDARRAFLDSFSESLFNLELKLAGEGEAFDFELPMTQAKFRGTRSADGQKIEGHWIQAGQEFPLTFERRKLEETRQPEEPKRPQVPEKPYPYREREVEFENAADGVRLSGTLTLPAEGDTFPAVILITGSGPQDRNESLLGHQPFLILADYLTRRGIAVLRYDERGVGKSSGDFAAADSRDLARDAEAAIEFLRGQPEIDTQALGLIGHSEGGLIAPMIAARRNDLAFIVLMAGPGVTGREIILNQSDLILAANGVSEEARAAQCKAQAVILDLISQDTPSDELKERIQRLTEELNAQLQAQGGEPIEPEMFEAAAIANESHWLRFFLDYDPRPALREVRCAILALNGSKDLQVDPKLNLPEIRKALEEGRASRADVREFENLNHLFQTSETGSPNEYRAIEETVAPVVLQAIGDWILDVSGRVPPGGKGRPAPE